MSTYRFEKCHGNLKANIVNYMDNMTVDAKNPQEALQMAIQDAAEQFSDEYSHADIDSMIGNNYSAYKA